MTARNTNSYKRQSDGNQRGCLPLIGKMRLINHAEGGKRQQEAVPAALSCQSVPPWGKSARWCVSRTDSYKRDNFFLPLFSTPPPPLPPPALFLFDSLCFLAYAFQMVWLFFHCQSTPKTELSVLTQYIRWKVSFFNPVTCCAQVPLNPTSQSLSSTCLYGKADLLLYLLLLYFLCHSWYLDSFDWPSLIVVGRA